MKNLLFSFEELSVRSDAAARKVAGQFGRAGAPVVQTDVSPRLMRSSGVTYREIRLTHADSQTTTLRVKQTGDVLIKSGTHVTVQAPSITLDAPQTTCTGKLTVDGLLTYKGGMAGSGGSGAAASIQGNVQVEGNVNASGSIMDGGGNSNHHSH